MPAKKTATKGKRTKTAQKKTKESVEVIETKTEDIVADATSTNTTQSAQSGGKTTKATKAKATKATKATKKTPAQKGGAKAVETAKDEPVKDEPVKSTKATKATKSTGGGTVTEDSSSSARYFKVIVDGSEAKGRFSGTKPKQAASKALSSILKDRDNKEGKIKFSIIECTRGSKHKKYNYIGERIELDNPMKVVIGKGTGDEKAITYKYNNRVMKDMPKNE